MADPIVEFFKALDAEDADLLATKVEGVIRVDLAQDGETDHWIVVVERLCIRVFHEYREADFVLRAERSLFEGLAAGRENLFAALMRRDITVEGNLQLLVPIERMLLPPPAAQDPRDFVRKRRASRR